MDPIVLLSLKQQQTQKLNSEENIRTDSNAMNKFLNIKSFMTQKNLKYCRTNSLEQKDELTKKYG